MSLQANAALYAITTAFVFGAFSLLVRKGGEYANSISGVFIGLMTSLPIMLAAVVLMWRPEWWNPWAFFFFTLAGLAGPAFSRVFLFLSINYMGVSRAMPMISLTPLFSSFLAHQFLGERPGPFIWTGTILIVAGSALLTYKKTSDTSWQRRHIWLAIASVVGASFSFLFRKIALEHVSAPIMGATLSSLTGLIFLTSFMPLLPAEHRLKNINKIKAWLFYGSCGLLNALGFILHFTAMSMGEISIVAPLTSTAPIFSLILSFFLLRRLERITLLIVLGTLCMVLGAGIISWKLT